jgi:copper resistance protein C
MGSAAVLTVLGGSMTLGAGPAAAHTELADASFGPGAVVRGPAADLTLSFTDPLVAEGTQVLVRDAGGKDLAGDPAVSGLQARVPLKGLDRPGAYRVTYRVVGVDGHPVTGSYSFRYAPPAGQQGRASTVAAVSETTAGDQDDLAVGTVASSGPSSSTWVIGGIGGATFAALLLVGARRRPADAGTRP